MWRRGWTQPIAQGLRLTENSAMTPALVMSMTDFVREVQGRCRGTLDPVEMGLADAGGAVHHGQRARQ